MFIGLRGYQGKGIFVESPEEKRDHQISFGRQCLANGILGVVAIAAISTFYSPDDTDFGFVMGGVFLLYALLGLWHLVAGLQIKENNSSPIPDHELIRITEFIKENDASDILHEHISAHGRLEWRNLQELADKVTQKLAQGNQAAVLEAKKLTGHEHV